MDTNNITNCSYSNVILHCKFTKTVTNFVHTVSTHHTHVLRAAHGPFPTGKAFFHRFLACVFVFDVMSV